MQGKEVYSTRSPLPPLPLVYVCLLKRLVYLKVKGLSFIDFNFNFKSVTIKTTLNRVNSSV